MSRRDALTHIANRTSGLRVAWQEKRSRSQTGEMLAIYNGDLLSPDELISGTATQPLTASDRELACVHERLHAGLALKMGALGGSNTAGKSDLSNRQAPDLYHDLLTQALNLLHPATTGKHVSTNGGVPQNGPVYHALCGMSRHLPKGELHLVMIDVAVNMPSDVAHRQVLTGHARSLERLLRQLRRHWQLRRQRPALVCVNMHEWRRGEARENASAAEEVVRELCHHYGVPLVSLHGALADSVAGRRRSWTHFMMRDGLHMQPPGHAFLAQLLYRLIEPPLPKWPPGSCATPPQPLPSPLLLAGPEAPARCMGVCADSVPAMGPFVVHANGFVAEELNRRRRSNLLRQPGPHSGYTASSAGASLSFRFCCPSVLFLVYSMGPTLGGALRECSGGCSCEARNLTAQWQDHHRVLAAPFSLPPTGCCTVTLRAFRLPALPRCPLLGKPKAKWPCSNATADGRLFNLIGAILGPGDSEEAALQGSKRLRAYLSTLVMPLGRRVSAREPQSIVEGRTHPA